MADIEDVAMTKMARRELGRRYVDLTCADVRVAKKILYVRGEMRVSPGGDTNSDNLKSTVEGVVRGLKSKSDIRDIVIDCTYQHRR